MSSILISASLSSPFPWSITIILYAIWFHLEVSLSCTFHAYTYCVHILYTLKFVPYIQANVVQSVLIFRLYRTSNWL
jgi:hypothetical protein